MRISVECGGYAEAAGVCRTANQVAALLTESLAGKLGAYAAMAGDDATSRGFAGSYDPAAREAVATLADLTHALIGLGRLVDASGRAHARAEASAVEAAGLRTNAYTGGGLDDDSYVRVSPEPPPSSLGGSVASGLGDVHAWILDQVEGFVWPGADADRLRDAAAAWRRTSGSVADLPAHLDVVAGLLERQLSPEIPLALAAIAGLRTLVEDTADQLLALADACDDYAGAVEDARDRTRALLTEIGQMVIEEVALTAIVAGITGGIGGGAKAAAALARIRAQVPRFHALLISLRAVVATTAARLRAARTELQGIGRALQPLCRARPRPAHFGPRSLGAAQRPRFEGSPKHRSRTVGRASRAPRDGQETLDVSLPVSPATTTRRVGYDDVSGEFVVFDETTAGVFHGHVRTWDDLTPAMQRVLRAAGIVDRRGRPIEGVE